MLLQQSILPHCVIYRCINTPQPPTILLCVYFCSRVNDVDVEHIPHNDFFTFSPEKKSIALGKHFFRVKVISCLMCWANESRIK